MLRTRSVGFAWSFIGSGHIMARSRYIIGIDLGTTNCAVAYVDTKGRERPSADVRAFEVPQLVAPGETAPRAMLPSFVYLPGRTSLPAGAARLPWRDRCRPDRRRVRADPGGEGPQPPRRERQELALPRRGRPRGRHLALGGAGRRSARCRRSPRRATCWPRSATPGTTSSPADDATHRFVDQEIILTVPASFDEAARELTVLAARNAGIAKPVLLEEPQAAFYCWIVTHQDGWQREVRGGELILVCDIGGGTTDFSLITVVETPTGPGFRRVAVGDHLMLGGDNVDLALAHAVEKKLKASKLDTEQWAALRLACRSAKEKAPGRQAARPLAGDDRRPGLEADRRELAVRADPRRGVAVVLDGFFPRTGADDEPGRGARSGLQEFGLPFVSDPAIPRHLATFLRRHKRRRPRRERPDPPPRRHPLQRRRAHAEAPPRPRRRRRPVLVRRGFGYAPRVLSNASLDLAVAHGAAYYGVVRRGGGIRIGGGTARSYYVGFEAESAVKPWLCVVPRDAEEGDEIAIDRHDFDLLMGQPVAFPLASSSVRPGDAPGDLVAADPDSILDLPPLVGVMRVGRKAKAERVPVRLVSRVTEVGTVELWCQSRADDRRWRLQIQLRTAGSSAQPAAPGLPITSGDADAVVIEQSEVDAALGAIRSAFAHPSGTDEAGPARLIKKLEEVLDAPREAWPPSALRAMWEPLREATEARLKTPRHESRWCNLAGFCLRPGTGLPARRDPDQAALGDLRRGGQALQGHPGLGRLVGPLAAGRRRPQPGPPRGDPQAGRPADPARQAGLDQKLTRPKPEAHELAEIWRCAARSNACPPTSRNRSATPWLRDVARLGAHSGLRDLVPRPDRRPGPALRPGQHRGARRQGDPLGPGPARPPLRPGPRGDRRRVRPRPARPGLGRPLPRPRRGHPRRRPRRA